MALLHSTLPRPTDSPAQARPIRIFTPSSADAGNTNPQNLTVKEVVARLPPERFAVTMLCKADPDPRIATRKNTKLLAEHSRGNTLLWLSRLLLSAPDIYFFPRQGPLDSAVFTLRKIGLLKPAIISYIVMMMNDATGAGLIGRSIREGDVVVANSSYVAETIADSFGLKTQVVFDGIDRRFFFAPEDRAPRAGDAPVTVLYAGSFQARKRVDVVIREAARWPNTIFRLAGRGETEAACRDLAQRLGCKNVVFLGHLSPAELGEEMRRSDVFLFPSILEGHPQVLGQAAACGLPAIAMKLYRPEYVVHGESGFLVESDAELAESLRRLLCDPLRRQSMSAAAVRHSREFDWDRITGQWMEIFQQAAKR